MIPELPERMVCSWRDCIVSRSMLHFSSLGSVVHHGALRCRFRFRYNINAS